jgi:hypothetical protein
MEKALKDWVTTAVAGTRQVGIARLGYLLALWLLLHHNVNFEQSIILILLGAMLEHIPTHRFETTMPFGHRKNKRNLLSMSSRSTKIWT